MVGSGGGGSGKRVTSVPLPTTPSDLHRILMLQSHLPSSLPPAQAFILGTGVFFSSWMRPPPPFSSPSPPSPPAQAFILGTGVFFSSWMGNALLGVGEWMIRRVPLIKHIYSASKQAGGGGVDDPPRASSACTAEH